MREGKKGSTKRNIRAGGMRGEGGQWESRNCKLQIAGERRNIQVGWSECFLLTLASTIGRLFDKPRCEQLDCACYAAHSTR